MVKNHLYIKFIILQYAKDQIGEMIKGFQTQKLPNITLDH